MATILGSLIRGLRDQIIDAEMRADEAFEIHTERLLARIDAPKRKRSFWR